MEASQKQMIEAALFIAAKPLTIVELKGITQLAEEEIESALKNNCLDNTFVESEVKRCKEAAEEAGDREVQVLVAGKP